MKKIILALIADNLAQFDEDFKKAEEYQTHN